MPLYATTRLMTAIVILALVLPPTARAQGIPVIDAQQIGHLAAMVLKTVETLDKVREQYVTIQRMSRGLPGMDTFKIPGIAAPGHDTSRYPYAARLLETLNAGDPRATNYFDIVRVLTRDVDLFDRLPPDVRQQLRAAYATIEVLDSTNHQAANQVGLVRAYGQTIGEQIDHLESLITSADPAFHQMTAVLDSIAAAELIAARQNVATTQIEANLVAQRVAKAKADRDAQVAHLDLILTRMRDRGRTAGALVQDAAAAHRGQP